MRRTVFALCGLLSAGVFSQPASAQSPYRYGGSQQYYSGLYGGQAQYAYGGQAQYAYAGHAQGGYYGVERPQAAPIPRQLVDFPERFAPGTVVISTEQRRLYYVNRRGEAIQYAVGVGRPGFEWSGTKTITTKREWPDWRPPAEMLQRRPDLPRYMPGGIENPLGARAMYLGGTLYRIHGSNEPETIGQAVSSGCIRMTNEDVVDLYERVKLGTRVVVLR